MVVIAGLITLAQFFRRHGACTDCNTDYCTDSNADFYTDSNTDSYGVSFTIGDSDTYTDYTRLLGTH